MQNGKFASILMLFALLAMGPSQGNAYDPYRSPLEDENECGKRAFMVVFDDPYEDQHTLTGRIQAPHPQYSYDLYMASQADEDGILKGKLILHAHEGKHVGQLAFVYIDEVIVFPEGTTEIWIKVDKDFPWGANNYRGELDMSGDFFCMPSYKTDDDDDDTTR